METSPRPVKGFIVRPMLGIYGYLTNTYWTQDLEFYFLIRRTGNRPVAKATRPSRSRVERPTDWARPTSICWTVFTKCDEDLFLTYTKYPPIRFISFRGEKSLINEFSTFRLAKRKVEMTQIIHHTSTYWFIRSLKVYVIVGRANVYTAKMFLFQRYLYKSQVRI